MNYCTGNNEYQSCHYYEYRANNVTFTNVIPTKVGIQKTPAGLKPLDPGFRRGDDCNMFSCLRGDTRGMSVSRGSGHL